MPPGYFTAIMIQIEDKIISLDLFKVRFRCDLTACRGECCVEGNAGAPLEIEECTELEDQYENYKPYMKPEGVEAVMEQGFAVLDDDGDLTTTLINGAECAYSIESEGGTWCAIEKAWVEGKTPFRKPISCHLYPIREVKFSNGTVGLQYHRWNICRAAEVLGRQHDQPLYAALREPIVRRFGQEFFEQLLEADRLISSGSQAVADTSTDE